MSVSFLFVAAALATGSAAIQQPSAAIPPKVAVEGCVESDGADKMGLDKHFVLMGGKVVKGKAPSAAPYRLHGLTDEQLKLHVGRRVRVDGVFGNFDASTSAPAGDELVELNVATIRQIPGDCSVPKS
jgi:hypothetical protein